MPYERAGVLVPGTDPGVEVGGEGFDTAVSGSGSMRLVSSANHRSTRFNHEELVGANWRCTGDDVAAIC